MIITTEISKHNIDLDTFKRCVDASTVKKLWKFNLGYYLSYYIDIGDMRITMFSETIEDRSMLDGLWTIDLTGDGDRNE